MNHRSIFMEEEAVEVGAHGRRVRVELPGSDAGGTANRERHPGPFLRWSPETVDVREGPREDGRTGTTMAGPCTTFAPRRLRKVATTPRRTMCVLRHDDPALEPTDLLRGQAEQHEVHVVVNIFAVTEHQKGTRETSF